MSQLRMKDDGDLQITSNKFTIVKDDDETRQKLLQRLRTFLGEWFLSINQGTPYFQIIFEKGAPPELINSAFKDRILGTKGVVELIEYQEPDLDEESREMTVDFKVRTEDGTLTITETLP